jgi:AraC-like DNA-binding protein
VIIFKVGTVIAVHRSYARAVLDRTNATSSGAGILRPDEFRSHADVQRVACADVLSPWVENHWLLRWDLPPGASYVSSVLPHPACNLTVEHGPPRDGIGTDRVVVTGVVPNRFDVTVVDSGWVFGVKFRPGGFAAFGRLDAGALVDRIVPAVDVLPAAVCEQLRTIAPGASIDAAGAVADRALAAARPSGPDPAYDTVLRLIEDMLADRTLVRVAQIEARHAIGRRQVERLFARYVGVGPKWVLARYRMHDVVTTLDEGSDESLAELAARYGWYDQAHFNRDFTRHVGVPPGEYRARARSSASDGPPADRPTA